MTKYKLLEAKFLSQDVASIASERSIEFPSDPVSLGEGSARNNEYHPGLLRAQPQNVPSR